jgi:hypothetical protein
MNVPEVKISRERSIAGKSIAFRINTLADLSRKKLTMFPEEEDCQFTIKIF